MRVQRQFRSGARQPALLLQHGCCNGCLAVSFVVNCCSSLLCWCDPYCLVCFCPFALSCGVSLLLLLSLCCSMFVGCRSCVCLQFLPVCLVAVVLFGLLFGVVLLVRCCGLLLFGLLAFCRCSRFCLLFLAVCCCCVVVVLVGVVRCCCRCRCRRCCCCRCRLSPIVVKHPTNFFAAVVSLPMRIFFLPTGAVLVTTPNSPSSSISSKPSSSKQSRRHQI
jgi:hypothetical protein